MLRSVYVLLAVCLMTACAVKDKSDAPVAAVSNVDLKRYMGTWYEIGSFPMFFQRQCVGNTQANYTVDLDGIVGVHNQCRTKDGIDSADGIAEVVNASGGAKLRVSFFRPFWADYWILGLDQDYRWAVVGNPARRNLWILSRTKSLSPDQLELALESARRQGFDLTQLHYTPQD